MVNQYCAHSFARNRQLPFLNQQKGENDRRKYFMINLHRKMLPTSAGVEPTTTWIPEPPRPFTHRPCGSFCAVCENGRKKGRRATRSGKSEIGEGGWEKVKDTYIPLILTSYPASLCLCYLRLKTCISKIYCMGAVILFPQMNQNVQDVPNGKSKKPP